MMAVHKCASPPCSLRAATSIHNHPRDFAVNDLLLVIEVEHVNG